MRFGKLILFSTDTGDAWALDWEDQLVLCLARDGVRQEYTAIDGADNYQIAWSAEYRIDGDAFVVIERNGRVRTIMGYPVRAIEGGAGCERS